MKVNTHCVGCGQCAAYCPYDAIIVFGRAGMNEKCAEYCICVDYCTVLAISGDG
ncbi:MAG: 4Fe-4S binding protein [Candidatus Methanoperedens sp.]|nr:4Fe-4S binding protein [Candidatus Methanoperedens sp.]